MRREPIEQRFWRKVNKDGPTMPHMNTSCWQWTGATNGKYGHILMQDKIVLAHRVSYEMHFGKIPKGIRICHKCDNTRCIRPDHLFAGTPADNSADMVTKGRQRKAKTPKRERFPRNKLTKTDVTEIRNRWNNRDRIPITQQQLAKEKGICPSVVNKILKGHIWKHVSY